MRKRLKGGGQRCMMILAGVYLACILSSLAVIR